MNRIIVTGINEWLPKEVKCWWRQRYCIFAGYGVFAFFFFFFNSYMTKRQKCPGGNPSCKTFNVECSSSVLFQFFPGGWGWGYSRRVQMHCYHLIASTSAVLDWRNLLFSFFCFVTKSRELTVVFTQCSTDRFYAILFQKCILANELVRFYLDWEIEIAAIISRSLSQSDSASTRS